MSKKTRTPINPRTYKLTHTPIVVQERGGGGGGDGISLWVFVLLAHSKINLHRLDSPELSVYKMIPFLLVVILDFTIFLKSQEITENWYKIKRHKAYEMYKSVIFWNLMKKTGKNAKVMDTQLTYQNFLEGWMNSYRKIQPLGVNRLFKTLKKPYWVRRGGGVLAPSPFVRPRVKRPPLISPVYYFLKIS